MEFSSRILLTMNDFTPKGQNLSLGELVKKYSEETSLYSNPDGLPNKLRLKVMPEDSREAISVLLAMVLIRPGWSSYYFLESLAENIHNMARKYMFEGKWKVVGELLSQQDFFKSGEYGFLRILGKYCSEQDFFGNILPLSYRMIKSWFRVSSDYSPYRDPIDAKLIQSKPKRKIRRRGYNDKGSRRPDHKWLPGYDKFLEEEEEQRQILLSRFPLKKPSSRYWFSSYQYGDGPRRAQPKKSLENNKKEEFYYDNFNRNSGKRKRT